MSDYTLLLVCGVSVKGSHNTFYSHILKGRFKIDKAVFLISRSPYTDFFTDLTKLIEESSRKHDLDIPRLEMCEIPGAGLTEIQDRVTEILPDNYFILDITGGRKIMAVGASLAYQRSDAEEKKLSYYLLTTAFTKRYKDMLIFDLFEDEWKLSYYD